MSAQAGVTPNGTTPNGVTGQAPQANANLPQELIDTMTTLFGKHPGYRTTHAKGLLVEGTFTPTEQAKTLSVAAHFNNPSTPVTARFSVGGGDPKNPDKDDQATPKGVAIRFNIDANTHTDLICHSFNGFATRTGEDFLTFLQLFRGVAIARAALAQSPDSAKAKENLDKANAAFGAFLATHPSAKRFATDPKPNPVNYGTLTYYQPNTHVLTNQRGNVSNVRYRLIPADGDQLITDKKVLDALSPTYLEDDLQSRLPNTPIVFTLQAHIADASDTLDDATIAYKSTNTTPVGTLRITKIAGRDAADQQQLQQQIAFSPRPDGSGIKGIASSNDPLIQIRMGVYAISAGQHRSEKQVEPMFPPSK